jgi:hypothetical protein
MLNDYTQSYLIGIIIGLLHIIITFGLTISPKTKPYININLYPFIYESRVILFNKHIHHWLIYLILYISTYYINHNKYSLELIYLIRSYSIVMIIHGLLYNDCFDFNID